MPTQRNGYGNSKVLAPQYRRPDAARLVGRWLTEKAVERMRRDGFCARRFSLMIRLPEGRGWSRAKTLTPSQDSAIFLKLFEAEWAQFHHERHGYVLSIGVHLGDVIPLSERPGELFLPLAPGEPNKREKLAATIDRINRRFGQRVVSYGVHQDHPGFFEKG